MSVYKRYNTRRKRVPKGLIFCVCAVLVSFVLAAALGNHLAKKAADSEALYTGTSTVENGGKGLAPLSEKSIIGEYATPKDIAKFVADHEDVCASTWIYKDGKATFATETDKLLDKEEKLPNITSLDIAAKTIGLFEVTSLYADEKIKNILTEYELSLLDEFAASGLDETVLVFGEVADENYEKIFDFAEKFSGAKMIAVPYSTLGNDVFFAEAASRQLPLALKVDGITEKQLSEDIDTYAFYFTRYNLRLILEGKDSALVDTLSQNALLNYQFSSPEKEGK